MKKIKAFLKDNMLLFAIIIFLGTLSYMTGLNDKRAAEELQEQEQNKNIILIEK